MTARPGKSVLVVLGICVFVEAALTLADLRVIDVLRLRRLAYEYGGFWPGLLRDWRPNYTAQPATMFLTYGFLHGGLIHLAVNMVTLLSLGAAVTDRVGELRFSMIYAVSILGGGLGFGLLASTLQPMVGASGALFGLAGALVTWDLLDQLSARQWPLRTLRVVVLLIVLNFVLWWAMSGHLAWQTHLGGFLAGALAAVVLDRS